MITTFEKQRRKRKESYIFIIVAVTQRPWLYKLWWRSNALRKSTWTEHLCFLSIFLAMIMITSRLDPLFLQPCTWGCIWHTHSPAAPKMALRYRCSPPFKSKSIAWYCLWIPMHPNHRSEAPRPFLVLHLQMTHHHFRSSQLRKIYILGEES